MVVEFEKEKAQSCQLTKQGIQKGLEDGQFHVHYQPQVYASSGILSGFEALVRWLPKEGESIPPCKFIPIAEELDVIGEIGEFVLRRVFHDIHNLNVGGYTPVHFGINLSAIQLTNMDTLLLIKQLFDEYKVFPYQVHFEITETALIKNFDTAYQVSKGLKDLGCRILMDDFGTGYSSLSLLRRFPISGVKIDRQFVSNLENDEGDFRITSSIIAMAHGLGLSVTAEGVEQQAQAQILQHLGCNLLQGYQLGKPAELSCYLNRLQLEPVVSAAAG